MKHSTKIVLGALGLAYLLVKGRKGLAGMADMYEGIDIGQAPVVPVNAGAYWAQQGQNYNNLAYGYGNQYNPYANYGGQYGQYQQGGYNPYQYSQQTYSPYQYNPYYQGVQPGATGTNCTTCPAGYTYYPTNVNGNPPAVCRGLLAPGTTYPPEIYPTCGAAPVTGYPYTDPNAAYQQQLQQYYQQLQQYQAQLQAQQQAVQPGYPVGYGTAGVGCQLQYPVGNRCGTGYVRYKTYCRPRTCPVKQYRDAGI